MARASSKTIGYDVQSSTTGESRLIFERTFIKSTRVAGRYITASKQYALFDKQGRKYTRESELIVTCNATGERFNVLGQAERIRKDANAR